jgi:murein DD-endopeptidase MepM/ murein hydrolase activator NlpD
MKTFDKSQGNLKTVLDDYLSGEQTETAWQHLETALLDPETILTGPQKDLLEGLRQDEMFLRADSRLLADYKTDAPDSATLRAMVRGWQQTRARKRVSSMARWGLSLGAALACFFLVVSLAFSLNGAIPDPTTHPARTAGVGAAAIATPTATVKAVNWPYGLQLGLVYPVPVKVRSILVSQFGDWVDGQKNDGIDIAAVGGTPILAAYQGAVVSAGWQDDKAGNTIVIDHGHNIYTRYTHLASVAVVPGQVVTKGQQIGIMGTTGDAVGIHLHFEFIVGGLDGENVDPLPYLSNFGDTIRYSHFTPTPAR